MSKTDRNTSWNAVAPWYNKLVGSEGHYYHEHVVIPNTLRLLDLQPASTLLDLGCGQGILAHKIPVVAEYLGFDIAPSLIAEAKKSIKQPTFSFEVKDVTKPLNDLQPRFSHAAIILALQNMEKPEIAIANAANSLIPQGKLLLVLNHPCFRIPRQSGWRVDEKSKQQFRWVNRYRSAFKIPIQMNPSQKSSQVTWSFHNSLHDYSAMLTKAGFSISALEEWTSDKESVGKAAKMENRARSEFPLFLCVMAEKK